MNITTITCTSNRPEAFALCESYLKRQTVAPFQMLVLDDGSKPVSPTLGQEYHHWPELAGRGSMVKKIRRAMEGGMIKGDAILFIEDDDWIGPDYIDWAIKGLTNHQLFGEGRALYYNVTHRWWFEHQNLEHASLCATAIRSDLFPWLLTQCTVSSEPFLDVRLWEKCPGTHRVYDPYDYPEKIRRSVGIKGMPGLVGYGGGHRGRDKSAVDDPVQKKLTSLIGNEAQAYANFYTPEKKPLPPERNGFITPVPKRINMSNSNHIARSECGKVHGPNWLKWLNHCRGVPNAVGMEIGTFEGDSAEWMAENIFTGHGAKYHCIDPFTGSIEHWKNKINVTKLEETTRAKLARFPQVEIHKGLSQDVVRSAKWEVDGAYIDGSHTARDTLRDAVLVFDLMKVGGVIIFDDLNWAEFPNELDRPKLGIETFMRVYAKEIEVIQRQGSQAVIRKKAE